MQRRSWMAALTLAAMAGASARADEPTTLKTAEPTARVGRAEEPASIKRKVVFNLKFSGLLYPGEVVIKPGNAGCRFKPIARPVKRNDLVPLEPIEIETFSADRDCSLVITLKEPGQPDKTMRRTFRVDAIEPANGKPQVFECLLSAMPKQAATTVAEKTAGPASTKK